jgi:hypothetical protein
LGRFAVERLLHLRRLRILDRSLQATYRSCAKVGFDFYEGFGGVSAVYVAGLVFCRYVQALRFARFRWLVGV